MAELNKVSVDDLKVTGKRVLVRVDFNVPMKDGVITNDNRIQAALPTINKLTSEGAKVILCSHLGKPKNGPEEKFSLKAAAARLGELVSAKVTFVPSDVVVDDTVKAAVDKMQNGEIIVLENTRFRKEETKNIESFSKDLASIADAFVMDHKMFDGLRSSTFSSSQVRSDLLEVRFDSISLFSFEIIYKQIEPK